MKRVKLVPHESTDSRESIELDEYTDDDDDEEDDVFMNKNGNGKNGVGKAGKKNMMSRERLDSAKKPLMKKKVRNPQNTHMVPTCTYVIDC